MYIIEYRPSKSNAPLFVMQFRLTGDVRPRLTKPMGVLLFWVFLEPFRILSLTTHNRLRRAPRQYPQPVKRKRALLESNPPGIAGRGFDAMLERGRQPNAVPNLH